MIPVTDSNLLSALTPENWVCQTDSINSTVCGASFTLGFNGTQQVALQVDNAHLSASVASRYPIITWSVNGGAFQAHQLVAGETSILLAAGVTNPVVDLYVKGMSPFEDRYTGDVPPNSVKITGFLVDAGGSTVAATLPANVWLNIGDSIMSGDAAAYAAGQGRPPDAGWAASDDGRASYGYLLARHYGYREARLAYGGYDWGGGPVPLRTLIDQKTSTISRLSGGFLSPIPEVVLINLGENGVPAATDVTQALVKLRSRVNPATKIIVMIPVAGTARSAVTQDFASYTNSSGDASAFLVDLGQIAYATADGQHPTAAGHLAIYLDALPLFNPIIGITNQPSLPPYAMVDTQPATATAFVGEPITFSAVMGGDQPMTYQWQRVSGGVTNIIFGETNTSLTLTNLQLTNTSSYFLRASNALGVGVSAAGSLAVSNLPAAANNIITAIAGETGRGVGKFVPGWARVTNNSLIAGQLPSSAAGNFSLEAPGRNVHSLTAGGDGALSVIAGTSGNTSSTNYVTCGNGYGAGASLIYPLTGSAYGYDLTNITVDGGWADNGRDQQAYTIYYSTVMAPGTFVPLTSINYNPPEGGGMQSATRVMFQSATGFLATNVAAVKFDFSSPPSENGYCGYSQLAVSGPAGAPVTIASNPSPAIIQTTQAGGSASAFDGAIAVNLIRAGQSSINNVAVAHGPSISTSFTTAGLNDGSAAANANLTYYGDTDPTGGNLPVTITFNLNTNTATDGFAKGYVITRIQVITGWMDSNLGNQSFQLQLSLNGGPFNDFGTFSCTTNTTALNNGDNSILQTLTGNAGTLASGVTGIRFVFQNPGGVQGGSGGTLIRELQVFGAPVVHLAIQTTADHRFQIAWPQGVLLEATNLVGPWTTNIAATSPFTSSPTLPQKYYRVRLQ